MRDALDELKKRRDDILRRNEGWRKFNDGSYEQALWESDYFLICDQIQLLEENNGKTNTTVGGNQCQDSKG
jgi:hypothetical protein